MKVLKKAAYLLVALSIFVFSFEPALVSLKLPQASADPGDGRMLLFWDGGAAPTGWTCVSCNPGDDFYQIFPRGNDTYGGTGGAATHIHTATGSVAGTGAAAVVENNGTPGGYAANTHTHTATVDVNSASNLPSYRELKVIRHDTNGEPTTIPSGAIGLFDASLPSGWAAYSAQNSYYPRGEGSSGTTAGSNTHSHNLGITIGAAGGTTHTARLNGTQVSAAPSSHTHTASGSSSTVNNEPPYIETIFGQASSDASPPDGLLAMWDDEVPINWTSQSSASGPFYQRFFKGAATYGSTGGNASHSHANTNLTTLGPSGPLNGRSGGAVSSGSHTHDVTVSSYSTSSHLPPYRDVIIGKRVPQSSFEQSAFRFYSRSDSTDVGSPLASLNTTATTPKQGIPFRLRILIHVSSADLDAGNKNFKLQVASRSGTCDVSFSGETYADVSPSSGAIRFYDNSTPTDGAALTGNANDPTHSSDVVIDQTYEESNNFTSTADIAIGEDGLWDFSLVDFSASASSSYCFRVVTSDGSNLNTYTNIPEIVTDDGNGHMILFYDGGSVPTGWTCISCNPGDDLYQRYFRGEASYGSTGGSATHSHTASASIANTTNLTVENQAGSGIATGGHTHPAFTPTIGSSSNEPPYRQLKIIRANTSGVPSTLPTGVIAMFDAAVPTGWTRYSAQDGRYIRGENTVGTTGGSATHTHAVTGTIGASSGTTSARLTGGTVSTALDAHTHNVNGTSSSASSEPPYIETILGQLDSSASVPQGIIAIWDNPIPVSWTDMSGVGQPFYQRFVRASASYGTTGGAASHTHADSTIVSDPTTVGFTGNYRSGTVNAGGAHTHDISLSGFSSANTLPPYINVMIAQLAVPNTAPNNPTNLDQKRTTDDSSIVVGGFAAGGQVKFVADATDSDNPDSLQLCVEVQEVGTSFSGTETACGSAVGYSGSAVEVSVTIAGLTDGDEYHWQARIKDGGGALSSWLSFGGNAETADDFTIDTSDPSGTVYDGSNEDVDIEYNNGSLNTLDANWDITDSGSGVALYEYSIGTSLGGTDIRNWTSNTTIDFVSASSLTLETSEVYYFNIRTSDNAGNQSILSSDGQIVAPTLTFSTSVGGVTFDNLNPSNSYGDTEDTTITTSTNARNGYLVRARATGVLQNLASDTIGMFTGGSYASPDEWLPGDLGYGYTSSDNLVQGVNKFSPATCAGGGSAPCFAPFSLAAQGDVVADNPGVISGSPINNEQFTITHRVTTSSGQAPGRYETSIIFSATADY